MSASLAARSKSGKGARRASMESEGVVVAVRAFLLLPAEEDEEEAASGAPSFPPSRFFSPFVPSLVINKW